MEQSNIPPAAPEDATKATAEQRELKRELDHQNDDPGAPGGHETRRQIADET
ncbi:hypothetical protein BH09ACT8_BH09ACT8_49310 [soil metagenome]